MTGAGDPGIRSLALPAELRFLLDALGPDGGSGETVGPDVPHRPELRWDRVVVLADWYRVAPLVHRRLSKGAAATGVPADVLAALRERRLTTGSRNLYLQSQQNRVLAALDGVGVPAMLLKGAALIEAVYPDISLRPMVDLDILVPDNDIARAHRAVAAAGYRSEPTPDLGAPSRRPEHFYDYPALVSEDGVVVVELHRHVMIGAEHFDIAEVWERASPSAVGVRHVLPAPEDLVLHAGIHFFCDRQYSSAGSLGQLSDIAWTVGVLGTDWDPLVRRARAYEVGGQLFLALLASKELLGVPVPPAVLADLRPGSYDPGLGREFIGRRVLEPAPPGGPAMRPRRRLLPTGEAFVRSLGRSGLALPAYRRLYLRPMASLAARGVSWIGRPAGLREEMRLTAWIRSLGPGSAP